jgi:hypothetical protein
MLDYSRQAFPTKKREERSKKVQEARSKKQETAREEKGAAHSYKKLNA